MPCCRKLRARAAPRSSRSAADSSSQGFVQRLGVRLRRAVGVDHLVVGVAAIAGQKPVHGPVPTRPMFREVFVTLPETGVRHDVLDATTSTPGPGGLRVRVRGGHRDAGRLPGAAVRGGPGDRPAARVAERARGRCATATATCTATAASGSRCRSGRSTLRFDALVAVPDATEAVDLDAAETPAEELPDDVLVYTLPSRYVLPDVLADEAWKLFGDDAARLSAGRCDLRPRQRAPEVHSRQQLRADHRGGRLRGRAGRLPRLRPRRAQLLPRAEHPGSLRVRLPAGDRGAGRWTSRWTSPPGSRCTWTAPGSPSTRATTRRARVGS